MQKCLICGFTEVKPDDFICSVCRGQLHAIKDEYIFMIYMPEGNRVLFPAKNIQSAQKKVDELVSLLQNLGATFYFDEYGLYQPQGFGQYIYSFYNCPSGGDCRYVVFKNRAIIGECDVHGHTVLDFCDKNCEECNEKLKCLAYSKPKKVKG